ncbi:Flp family type IVb pilin [Erwinia sp. V71]|uniref:Flp family type IVb pilin n=1 Tax=Erwinia sp. V71 TaxID=3369424 RepID=UPI003F5ECB5A
MNQLKAKMRAFFQDESGVTAIEYGILAAAMAAAIGAIFGDDGIFVKALNEKFTDIANQITGSGTTSAK